MEQQPKATNAFVIGFFTVLAIATFAAYSSIGASEILRWDDNIYLNSELVQSLGFENLAKILYTQHHSNWHPLTTLSFAIENALWGQNAVYAKIVNICLHLVVSFLFYLLSFRLLLLATAQGEDVASPWAKRIFFAERKRFALLASLFAATLFALHPQHVESVAWVSERKGLLCSIFYLAALICYVRQHNEQKQVFANLTIVFMLLALMSKPMAVSLPIALMLLDVYPLRKIARPRFSVETLRALLHGKLIYIMLSLASVMITLLYQDPQSGAVLGYLPRLVNACAAYLHYLGSIFYPLELSPFYPFAEFSLQPSASSLLPVLALVGLAAAAVWLYARKVEYPLVVFAFFAVSLLPVIGLVKVGRQSMADRYAYLPTIWIYLLLGVAAYALLASCKQQLQRYLVAGAFAVLCALLGLITLEHTRHWREDVAMWERVIEIYPERASIAYINLASALDAGGRMNSAGLEQLVLKALEIEPRNPYNLGAAANFYGELGQEDKALDYLLKMAEAAPYNYWARSQIGDIYFNRMDYIAAGNYYLEALRIGEDSQEVIYRLALIDFHFQRYEDVLAKLELLTQIEFTQKKYRLNKKVEKALAQKDSPSQ